MEKEVIKIRFNNVADFKNRICRLWQEQKENELYEFEFSDEETEKEFMKIIKVFVPCEEEAPNKTDDDLQEKEMQGPN